MINKFLPDLFENLNSQNIKYCVWGNYEFLPVHLNGSDLDIVVKEKHKDIFKSILKKCIRKYNGRIISYFNTNHSEHFRILGINDSDSWGILIDVMYEQLYFYGNVYLSNYWIWNFTSKHKNIIVNHLGFSYLAGFLKELLHNGNIKDKYFLNSISEIQKNQKLYEHFIISSYGENFFNTLLFELKKPKKEINLNLLRKKLKNNVIKSKWVFLINFISKLKRLFNQPGFTIAFLGVDGSGKSTIIEYIKPTLNNAFHKAVYYEHMRPNKLPSIAYLFGKKENFNNPVNKPHEGKASGFVGSLFRLLYYLLDYTIGFYLKIWPKIATRSCVWIFDRYYYDFLIDPLRSRIKIHKWIIKLGQLIIPEPDLILCLGTNANSIHKRKPELTLNEIERQVLELKIFCETHQKAVWIDTGKDIAISSEFALDLIIKMMSKRFEKVYINK